MPKTAAEINAERIAAIIYARVSVPLFGATEIARAIVEALPELRPAQQSMERDGSTRTIAEPLPWADARRRNEPDPMSEWLILTPPEGPTTVRAADVVAFRLAHQPAHLTKPTGSMVRIRTYPDDVYVSETPAEIARMIGS